MGKMTFRETMILSEARKPDLVYKEKVVKNKIDRVIVELEGNQSGAMTRLASKYDRLEKAIKKMGEKRDELNAKIKTEVEEIFAPEDVVLTRVVETVSFTMTLSKLVKSEEQEPKKVVKYDKIAEELAKLIPDELQAQVDEIVAKYTEISIAAEKSPALRVKAKVDESLNEGIMDTLKSIAAKLGKWLKDTAKWAVNYDKKLDALKKQASKPVMEGYDTSPKNREQFDDYNEWVKEVRSAGADVFKKEGQLVGAMGHEGECGEFDKAKKTGWLVAKWSKK